MARSDSILVREIAGYLILRVAPEYGLIGDPMSEIHAAFDRSPTRVVADTRGYSLSSATLGFLIHLNKIARDRRVEMVVLIDDTNSIVLKLTHLDKLLKAASQVPDDFPAAVRAALTEV